MDEQFLRELVEYQLRPTIIDRVSKNLIFFGFPLPSCKGSYDNKWLIQIYVKDESGIERTGFVNGKRDFTECWNDRYSLEYKQGENFTETIEFEV